MTAPRVLFLSGHNPWLLNAGGLIRNYWIVRALARRYAVDVVTAGDPHDEVPDDFRRACASIRRYPAVSSVARLARALKPSESIYTAGAVSRAMRVGVRQLLRSTSYRAIVIGDLPMVTALPAFDSTPILYNAQNCETALLLRRAATETSLAPKLVTALDARRLRPIESTLLQRAALVMACSQADIDDLAELSLNVRSKTVLIPNGVDAGRYESVAAIQPPPDTVLVTGSFDWRPNQVGLRWFLREVIPILQRLSTETPLRVRVAGRMDSRLAAEIDGTPLAEAAPNVADMGNELARAAVVVAPILASSGTRLRILEAWAAARPVVTTPEGAFGLDYLDGTDLIVRTGAEPFARAIVDVLRDSTLRETLRRHGAVRAREYDWREIGDVLLAACDDVLSA